MLTLRPYQQEAADAALAWVRKSTDPCIIHAPTGAGKSLVIAEIARVLHDISGGKKVLVTAPVAELVVQDAEKYAAIGGKASIMSASAGSVCMRHPVVFGTPGTVKNRVRRFGADFCAIILDEAHRITPQIKSIISNMREKNPNLRVIGLSATPYRMGDGYIYAMDESGKPMGEHASRDPYFTARVYTISERYLIEKGFLTEPVVGAIGADGYETSTMALNSRGQFDVADVDRAYHGHGRKTANIVADVVAKSRDRQGVMLFAATIQHAEEIMASLPPGLSALVTGKTKASERAGVISRFKAKELKYLVNVSVLTTGFDAPHVDVIALLRATESVSLLQQIVGRGLRIDDDKESCLVLDYAENIKRHCPDFDIFNPTIKASFRGADAEMLEAECPECHAINEFSARKNDDDFEVDQCGYFLDLAGNRVVTEYGPMPAHYGRRCTGLVKRGATYDQCVYRWTCKECPHCDADNDIAARHCVSCKGELIDPAEKLSIEFRAFKKDPTRIQTDRVVDWQHKPTMTRKGNECRLVTFTTEYRSFTVWYHPYIKGGRLRSAWIQLCDATGNLERMPVTVTYRKDGESGFYETHAFGEAIDAIHE